MVTQLPQQRQVSWACQAVARERGSNWVTVFSYVKAASRISPGEYQVPSLTLLKYQEWHLRHEKLHPDW
jgi:hypothetical protein